MNGALAVFVKTPGLSPLKTRLAAGFTTQLAEQFYHLAVQATTEVVREAALPKSIEPYYAVAEQQAIPCWTALPAIWQGEGGLGERMDSIYRQLLARQDFVILIGSDIPQLTADHLFKAITALRCCDFVVAPSQDGGFWLFGGRRALPARVWTEVAYSQADTAQQFLHHLEAHGDVSMMDTLRDVDEVSDLPPLQQELAALTHPTPSQRQLLYFLEQNSFHYA